MSEKKKNIIIFPGFYPPHIGGLETVAAEQAEFLSDNNKITIFAPQIPSNSLRHERLGNIEIIRYPAFEIVRNFPLPKFWKCSYWQCYKLIKQKRYNTVITHTRFFSNSLLGVIFAKRQKTKLCHIEHGSAFVKVSSRFVSVASKIYDLTIGKYVLKSASQIVAISEAVKRFIITDLRVDKEVKVIYRGLKLNNLNKIKPHCFDNEKINLVFAGRLIEWKGVTNSIKAVQSLPSEIKEKICFNIIGDGPDAEKLKSLALNDKTITFHGLKNFDESISYLKGADIYIHSAYPGGGLATSLLEAMYCENIIVASPHEGADEVVDSEVGVLLKGNSAESIAEGIKLALPQFDNITLKTNARQRISQRFNWSDKIKEYEELFSR